MMTIDDAMTAATEHGTVDRMMGYTRIATILYMAGHGETADAIMDAGIAYYAALLTGMYNATPNSDKATVIVAMERMCRFVRDADAGVNRRAAILDGEITNELDDGFAGIEFVGKEEEST
nr:MAG TPA: hypothetical protein [Caudoviricetes sp.]